MEPEPVRARPGLRGLVGGPLQPLLVLASGVLVVVAVVAASTGGPWAGRLYRGAWRIELPDITLPSQPPPSPPPEQQSPTASGFEWVGRVLLVLLVLAGLVVVVLVVQRWIGPMVRRALRVRRADPPPPEDHAHGLTAAADLRPDVERLREGLAEAAGHLAEHGPPADAVVAAWIALEHAAERSGVQRDRAQTPTEFTLDVLDATPADPAATRVLLGLYHRARFSEHGVEAPDVAEAARALTQLSAGLDIPDDDVRTVFDLDPEES